MDRATGNTTGLGWGLVGVVGFSLTLPMTRMAVPWLGATEVGWGRTVVAALVASAILIFRRDRFPRAHGRALFWVVAGVVLGFPLLSAWAMARVPASHGAVMLALLPLATAGAGVWRARERPSLRFWAASGMGASVTVAYALAGGGGHLVGADAALLAAVALAALGYGEGGRLAVTLGGWRVICWALVLSLPVTLGPVTWQAARVPWGQVPIQAWVGFLYVALGSQLTAFFAWYRGLAVGGIARVSQLQYLQVFLTLAWSAWWLHERVTWLDAGPASLVVAAVMWGKGAVITKRPIP